jgi:MFS family permease
MTKERKINSLSTAVSVLLVAILCQSSGAESPALQYIADAFPNTPMTTITLISTLPSIMMIPASLLFSAIRKKVSIRKLFLVFMIITIVGGVMPSFAQTVTQILIWRAIFGFGLGIMWPLAQSLIVELYQGDRQNTMLGLNSVVTACGGILWGMLGGVLALQGWRISFYVYLIPIIVLVIVMIWLPEPPKIMAPAADPQAAAAPRKKGALLSLVVLLIAYFIYNFANMTYFVNLSLKVVGEGLGNSAQSGLAQSIFTVGSLVIGLTFGFVMRTKLFKSYSLGIGWLLTGIGFFIVSGADVYSTVLIGSFIQCFGTGMFMPTMIGLFGKACGAVNAAVFIGISTCVLGLSQFVGPQVLNSLVSAFGEEYGSFPMFLGSMIHLVCAVITIIVLIILNIKKIGPGSAEEPAPAGAN